MELTYRFARTNEYPRISAFLDEFWAKQHVYCRNERLFDWTFLKRSHWELEGFSFALAEDQGALAGILGGIPFTFNRFGQTSKGIWIANYVIRPDHRKGPAALQLLSMFRRPEFDPVIAFGINPATAVIYRVLHGAVLPEIPRHFMVLPGAEDRVVRFLRIARADWDQDQARDVAEKFRIPTLPATAAEPWDCVPSTWDRREWPQFAEQTIGAARDSEYLRWRYSQHPCFEYRFIAIPDNGRVGMAVWRLETIRQHEDGTRTDIDRIGRLVEFLPVSIMNARALLHAFLRQLKQWDAFGADYYGYHGPTSCMLDELGFSRVDRHRDGGRIPTRFQPLDGHGGGILSAMFLQTGVPPCSAAADCAWYWTKSDSDQDRPN